MTAATPLTETQLHKQVFDYLRWALDDNAMAFHIPMGGSRNEREAIKLKKLGSTAGIPDLEILYRGRAFFIELKSKKGALSASQKYMIPRIERAGCPAAVCRSMEDVTAFLREHGVPLRIESITTERIRRGMTEEMAKLAEAK